VIPSLWRQTPWGKANGGQWRYALRNALAMCLSLWLAFVLQLDSPYWAMTSAAVVSFPTVGGVISKSLGRVVGSLIGAMAAVMITGLGIGDPWLFSLLIALWLGVAPTSPTTIRTTSPTVSPWRAIPPPSSPSPAST
jgi:uncharacterized membrane protein YccC